LGGIAGSVLLSFLLDLDMSHWQAAVLGMLLAVAAQIGDLAESKLKRISGVKEAGGLIPGHGGILDRLDSILLTGVVVYYWAYYVA
jgi:phosphatidate cytidylyltransferase